MYLQSALALSLALPSLSTAARLFATHYDGKVYSLNLEEQGDKFSLTKTHDLTTCGGAGSASALTVDSNRKLLWCVGEGTPGALTALKVEDDGKFNEAAKVETRPGGVDSVMYGKKQEFLAIAHYGNSSISLFNIPFKDNQEVEPFDIVELPPPKVVTEKQSKSQPHQVLLDPTGAFLLSPDLGADVMHVFAIDQNSGKLNKCAPNSTIYYEKGSGPRHGVFVTSGEGHHARLTRSPHRPTRRQGGKTTLYTVEELRGYVCAFDVSYVSDGCPVFTPLSNCFRPYPDSKFPSESTTLAEIRAAGPSLHISVRKDAKFNGDDSLVTLKPDQKTVTDADLFSSGGKTPRSFVINKKGDLVAVANQDSSTVVIVKRDPQTGKLLKEVASLLVGEAPAAGVWGGLSSIVWYE
ncbi:Lactonase, 7-bladed beta-propeller-domain-containing protein [Aspergillus bertholletiae]|uniref:Lactonase, 7-bladed beta-propeller-domain-containing protein n=1 Tax=Aspergillus bertholletiae TaxID=1226010 RepID=A0A5N7AU04_9EURO|nr:Lactonase, 7-bladed beta-propeller-domain-containing protein [Aspergillus bertholletiae]